MTPQIMDALAVCHCRKCDSKTPNKTPLSFEVRQRHIRLNGEASIWTSSLHDSEHRTVPAKPDLDTLRRDIEREIQSSHRREAVQSFATARLHHMATTRTDVQQQHPEKALSRLPGVIRGH